MKSVRFHLLASLVIVLLSQFSPARAASDCPIVEILPCKKKPDVPPDIVFHHALPSDGNFAADVERRVEGMGGLTADQKERIIEDVLEAYGREPKL